ncbi:MULTISPECIES: hypothetical protein [unclassified Picosynechococcus]|uniref:hypothetical protein n=2 Tax=Cyanophyceae TaxID=3028117 RepID=UPI00016DCE5D|nr:MULTISPECIES: hypothetical protein [unclassified Picosynechococcus]ACB00925.1 hypothetical protein SYNPCC7002_E0033 [Picosynechococcus sp. PCC 7002]SMH58042.1 hypothetical protein SAMN06272755_3124 [Picosynechococcus sp. OG1]
MKINGKNQNFLTPNFKNPNNFARYCYLYDPSVEIDSAIFFDKDDLKFGISFQNLGLSTAETTILYDYDIACFYSCIGTYCEALFDDSIEQYKQEYVLNFLKELTNNGSFEYALRGSQSKLIQYLSKNTILIKRYLYCTDKDLENIWFIILRPLKSKENSLVDDEISYGFGSTLQDANINLAESQAKSFDNSYQLIKNLAESEIPLTPQEMYIACSKFDSKIDPLSLKPRQTREWLNSTVPSNYYLQCRSNKTKFSLTVDIYNIKDSDCTQWKVEKFLNVDRELSILIDQIPIIGFGNNLESAFNACQKKYNLLKSNRNEFEEAVSEYEYKEEMEMREFEGREGIAHMNWLISEFGEDVFPDRD